MGIVVEEGGSRLGIYPLKLKISVLVLNEAQSTHKMVEFSLMGVTIGFNRDYNY